jgi:hypothetical protein
MYNRKGKIHVTKEGFFENDFLWTAAKNISGKTWWTVYANGFELSKFAIKVLDLPATTAACERSFSSKGLHKIK